MEVEALDYALGHARPDTSLVFILAVAEDLGLDLKETVSMALATGGPESG